MIWRYNYFKYFNQIYNRSIGWKFAMFNNKFHEILTSKLITYLIIINYNRHHLLESASRFLSFAESESEFWTLGRVFWINTSRIPGVYLLLLNDPGKFRVQWHLGCIFYCVFPVQVRVEILIRWLALPNSDFLVWFSVCFYNNVWLASLLFLSSRLSLLFKQFDCIL